MNIFIYKCQFVEFYNRNCCEMSKTVNEFCIRESTIRGLIKAINSLIDDQGNLPSELSKRRTLFRNQSGKYSAIDEKLFAFTCDKRKAKEIGIQEFSASDGYVGNFLNRFSMVLYGSIWSLIILKFILTYLDLSLIHSSSSNRPKTH